MSQLFVYHTSQPIQAIKVLNHYEDISSTLEDIGVRFEQWQAEQPLNAESSVEEILAAYQTDITRLQQKAGYSSADVISIDESLPEVDKMRNHYLAEHTYTEDTVRFMVSGRMALSLHIDEHVYVVLCAKGCLISVPAGIRQWSDIGERPRFTAIRLFNSTEGLVVKATGDKIAEHYPALEDLL